MIKNNEKFQNLSMLFSTVEKLMSENKTESAEKILIKYLNSNKLTSLARKNIYKYLGKLYFQENNFLKSAEYLIRYLAFDKKTNFEKEHYNMLIKSLKNFEYSQSTYDMLKKTYKMVHDNMALKILILNEISNYYSNIGKTENAQKLKNKIMEFLSGFKKRNFYYLKFSIYNDFSDFYFKKNQFVKAWFYLQKAIYYHPESLDHLKVLKYALKANRLRSAKKYIQKLISKQKDLDLKTLIEFLELKSEYYEAKKDYKAAYRAYDEYFLEKNKYLNQKNQESLSELQAKYELEKKKQEKEIYQLENIELKNINLSKDKFFSIIAHDLRSPFATIYSFISLMKKNFKNFTKEKTIEYVNELEKIVTNAYSLLENLLEWSRIQSGNIKYNPEVFDIKEVAKSVISLSRMQAENKNIKLINLISDKTEVFADRNMIRTVLRNLINNSIKFTYPNGTVTIKLKEMNDFVEISISDTGVGMSKDALNKLFKLESSFSTTGTNKEKGTGLGLILCKEFVEKNKGKIFVESKLNKGSIFGFTIPKPIKKEKSKNEK